MGFQDGLKGYVEVKDRITAFLSSEQHKGWYYTSEIIDNARPKGVVTGDGLNDSNLGYVQMKTTVFDDNHIARATGYAQELEGKGMVNKTSYLENCETSAVGRALGMLGFGIEKAIASKDEIEKTKQHNQNMYELYNDIFITEDEAKKILFNCITDLRNLFGITKESLANLFKEHSLDSDVRIASISQILRLERELRKANFEDDRWHSCYGTNLRKKPTMAKNTLLTEDNYINGKLQLALKAYELASEEEKENVLDHYDRLHMPLDKYIGES